MKSERRRYYTVVVYQFNLCFQVKSILKFYYILSGMNVTYTAVPLLVTLVTFATFIHIDPINNVVTVEKVTI